MQRDNKAIRVQFKKALDSGVTQQFPGAFNAMVGMLIEEHGFQGVYCSGAVASNSLGLADVGITTLDQVTLFVEQIIKKTTLPVIADADTGFENAGQTVYEFEKIGCTGIHIEDQVDAKLCGHLDGKQLISPDQMVLKLKEAVSTKKDENFQIIARTDAKSVEGIEAAIDRAKAYVDAGADMIFPEALHNEKEMELFRKAIDVPLLSNMTEFGKTEILTVNQIQNLGYNMVIYPVSMQRLAMMAVENGLESIKHTGSQKEIITDMQTRKRLYEVLGYKK
jgi:methylisocitrate lyase